jgi:hypothetical protein
MPPNLAATMTSQDLADIIAYLMTLSKERMNILSDPALAGWLPPIVLIVILLIGWLLRRAGARPAPAAPPAHGGSAHGEARTADARRSAHGGLRRPSAEPHRRDGRGGPPGPPRCFGARS